MARNAYSFMIALAIYADYNGERFKEKIEYGSQVKLWPFLCNRVDSRFRNSRLF